MKIFTYENPTATNFAWRRLQRRDGFWAGIEGRASRQQVSNSDKNVENGQKMAREYRAERNRLVLGVKMLLIAVLLCDASSRTAPAYVVSSAPRNVLVVVDVAFPLEFRENHSYENIPMSTAAAAAAAFSTLCNAFYLRLACILHISCFCRLSQQRVAEAAGDFRVRRVGALRVSPQHGQGRTRDRHLGDHGRD